MKEELFPRHDEAPDQNEETASAIVDRAVVAAIAAFRAERVTGALGSDSDRTHDARIAMRRLRSYLRTFGPLYARGFTSRARADLKWYAALLGVLRDLDVLEERLGTMPLPVSIARRLTADRSAALETIAQARATPRFNSFLEELSRLQKQPQHSARADAPARQELLRLMVRPWRDLREAGKLANREATESNLHQLRIRSKELRYAAELASTVFDEEARRLANSAKSLQDRIGVDRDAKRLHAFLLEFVDDEPSWRMNRETIFAREDSQADQSLASLPRDLRRVRRDWHELHRQAKHHR